MRKKHNMTKRHERTAKACLKGLVVAFVAGQADGMAQLVNRRTMRPVACGQATADALALCQFKWSVFCAVTCRRQDGQEYMQSEFFKFEQPYRQSGLCEYLNDKHKTMLKGANPEHRVSAAWIACPHGEDISESYAAELITKLGGWEFLAKWEDAA